MHRSLLAWRVGFLCYPSGSACGKADRPIRNPQSAIRNRLRAAGLILLAAASTARGLEVKAARNTERLMPYQVFELTFQHEGKYHNPTWDVTIDVTFTSPTGNRAAVGGFFYGSSKPQKPVIHQSAGAKGRKRSSAEWPCDPADLWKARYAPSELGRWTYEYTFRNKGGESATGSGAFEVVKGRVASPGWVRISTDNPFRLVFEDGSPYWPIGFQDGFFDNNHNGSGLDESAMEGPFRNDTEAVRPSPPPGALFARGPSMNPLNCDVHFGRHGRAGFNLWRFSPHNFSLPVFDMRYDTADPVPAAIRWEQAIMVDDLLRMTRKYGMRNMYGLFGFAKVFNDVAEPARTKDGQPPKAVPKHYEDPKAMAKVKAMVKYSVDRWGAYADIWEILNEQKAPKEWYDVIGPYLKSIDPYRRPVATSWERPELASIDISAPHWYGREDELSSDQTTAGRASGLKKHGKPVIFGEQGNGGGRPELIPQGIGGVWDPGSARRMRIRNWTAMFTEMAFIFWETSYAKDGHSMNIWLGPEERQYVKAMQDFAACLGGGMKMAEVHLGGEAAKGVRAYALRSDKRAGVYLHHFTCAACAKAAAPGQHAIHQWDHDRGAVEGLTVAVDVPAAAKVFCHWYDPRDGSIVKRIDAPAGKQTLEAPPFTVDLALLITEGSPPDADRDGKPNDQDEDDDNDGVPDAKDAFPLEREEWADADADRIGDNLDADIDGDGKGDDRNGNGKPDCEETDWDGDGVPNAAAVPWDAFPHDPKEWRDTDGDGIGDNADTDDDGDGWSDEEEKKAGTDPLDPVSFPKE